jgi:hypothetical protein
MSEENPDELVPGPIRDHMQTFANVFTYFHDMAQWKDLDTMTRIRLFEDWLKQYNARKDAPKAQAQTQVPSKPAPGPGHASEGQHRMLRRLIKAGYLDQDEVQFENLTKKTASDLITKGIAAEEADKKASQPQAVSPPPNQGSFGGAATL